MEKSASAEENRENLPEGRRAFERPGPGTWVLDAAHCERPRSRYMNDLFARTYAPGFRAGFDRYGAMLETIEYAPVQGFVYTSVRPLGAPPDAKGPPPRFVLKLLSWLHPALRRRIRRAEQVLRERPWRDDVKDYYERQLPAAEEALLALGAEAVDQMSTSALVDHLGRAHQLLTQRMLDHFHFAGAAMLPVGDFLAHTTEWAGCTPNDALALLRGASPDSIEPVRRVEAAAKAVRAEPEALRILESDAPAAERLDKLRALRGSPGEAMRGFIDRVGHRIVTGHDISELTALELPESLLASLAKPPAPRAEVAAEVEMTTRALRDRVPDARRPELFALLEEARLVHRLRDGRCGVDFWAFGLLRRAVIEAGRRLAGAAKLERAEDAVDLTYDDLVSLLGGGPGPSGHEAADHARWRRTASAADAPEVLGPPPQPRPASDWLPPAAARIDRAFAAYIDAMQTESTKASSAKVIRGLPASPGRYTGTARVVLEPEHFEKVRQGDVLVAWITTPTYNVLLPLLGAVVTDRGGLLSHPAIISRELGIPGVVGCRQATKHIRDGARVEVDGDGGTVTVLG